MPARYDALCVLSPPSAWNLVDIYSALSLSLAAALFHLNPPSSITLNLGSRRPSLRDVCSFGTALILKLPFTRRLTPSPNLQHERLNLSCTIIINYQFGDLHGRISRTQLFGEEKREIPRSLRRAFQPNHILTPAIPTPYEHKNACIRRGTRNSEDRNTWTTGPTRIRLETPESMRDLDLWLMNSNPHTVAYAALAD